MTVLLPGFYRTFNKVVNHSIRNTTATVQTQSENKNTKYKTQTRCYRKVGSTE